MAKIALHTHKERQFGGFSPFGNVTSLKYRLLTNAVGAALNSTSAAAIADGDVIDLGSLPAGMALEDASVFVATGMSESVTGKLGFAYEDGVDSADVPQDDAYFFSGKSLATAGRVRADGSKLVVLPKAARLVLTIGGADNAKASDLVAVVTGELTGPR